ncbi:aromatic ring-hydroxylating dioxygenase subunit alpha, partial [Streptomyces sp. SID7499]|nr:aromatic ring-hydroxylating dioxygenase subunit alpha [Streptomyces sp. SID7499]
LRVAWPFIRHFTERVFAEDRMAVEAEQRAWDEQGEDRNHEVFPLILDVRDVLRANGVPLRPRAAAGAGTPACDGRACDDPVPGSGLLAAYPGHPAEPESPAPPGG